MDDSKLAFSLLSYPSLVQLEQLSYELAPFHQLLTAILVLFLNMAAVLSELDIMQIRSRLN